MYPIPGVKALLSALLLNALLWAAPVAHAAVTLNGTVNMSATLPTRLLRDAVPSSCGSPKTFPGTFGSGTFGYTTHTVYNPGAAQCVTINVDVGTCGANVFVAAYLGAFNPANLSANYLADQGSSATGSFSFTAPAGSTITLMASNTSAVAACNYTITSTQLMPNAVPVPVPALTTWTLLALSLLMVPFALWRGRQARM